MKEKKTSFLSNNNNNNNNSTNAFLLNTHCWHRPPVIRDSYHFCFCWHAAAAMREPCARTAWFSLASSPPPRVCADQPLYIILLYSRASRDVSGLPGPGPSFFSLFFSPPSSESAHPPERRALPARISAPRCVTTTEAAMGGWKDGRTNVVT